MSFFFCYHDVMSEMTEKKEEIIASQEGEVFSQSNEQAALAQEVKIQQQKLDEVEQSVSKQNTKKSKILNAVFFAVNLAVVAGILVFQLIKEDFVPLTGLRFDPMAFVWIALLLIGVVAGEAFIVSYLLKSSTGKWKPGLSYKVANIGRYYDSVTPMSSGGQAFQVSYLKSRGTPLHTSLSIPLAKYVFGQIAWVIISLIALIVSWTDKSYGTFVSVTSIIGFVLSFFVLFVTLFLSISKKIGRILVVKVLKLLYKMKIVKNYEKQYEKITKYISDFQDVMKQYAKSPKDFLILTFASIVKFILNYSMPFFIVKAFGVQGLDGAMYFKLYVMSILVELSASFFPLPGGTGMNELSFTAAFGAVVGNSAPLVWVLIFWRFCSYYFYLVQGVIILSYDMAYGNRKYKWQVVRNNLAEESSVFKQQQINKFRADRAKRRKNKSKVQL